MAHSQVVPIVAMDRQALLNLAGEAVFVAVTKVFGKEYIRDPNVVAALKAVDDWIISSDVDREGDLECENLQLLTHLEVVFGEKFYTAHHLGIHLAIDWVVKQLEEWQCKNC